MKYKLFLAIFIVFSLFYTLVLSNHQAIIADEPVSITNISIGPSLDISRFSSYTITADIANYPTGSPVSVGISGINGDGGSHWNYLVDGTPSSEILNFDMTYVSGTTWQKTNIYPDYIYPEIYFATSSITWNNTPQEIDIRRNNYHLFHLQNPFTMVADMSFWIEVNAIPNAANSADLQVYLVKKDKTINYFQSDWRQGIGNSEVELVGTISRNASFHHTHTSNSSHYLVPLTANADGTIGSNYLDISGDFWIIVYNTSPNISRGWDLRYQPSTLCATTNRWYRGNQNGWTTVTQAGCPDAHIHLARRDLGHLDGVTAVVSAGSTSASQSFYYASLPNLAPVPGRITNPNGGSYSGTINITWDPASDPNGDSLAYYLYLLNSDGTVVDTLSSGTTATLLSWNTTTIDNNTYGIGATVCDPGSLCSQFTTDNNFYINNTTPLSTLSSITLASNNSDPTQALTGDLITLTLVASSTIPDPTISFYSAGYSVINSPSINYTGDNTYTASFAVDASDTNGEVTFVISSSSLESQYYQTTDSSSVNINNPVPTSTPTPTLTPTPTSTPTSAPTPTSTSTPTPTSTPIPTNSNYSSSGYSPSVCTDTKPFARPDLFQIDISQSSAKLFFTPLLDTNNYYVSFSQHPNAEEHGTQVSLLSQGVQSYTVYFLKPNTYYYFKVRGQNGCMPGDWSSILRIKTSSFKSFYKYYSPINSVVTSPVVSPVFPTLVPTIFISPPRPTPVPISRIKKCFLWWCW